MFRPASISVIGGKGIMGRFFVDFLRKNGFRVLVADRHTSMTNSRAAAQSDVVLIAVPIHATEEVIEEITPVLTKNHLLLDVTSLKVLPIKKMLKTKAHVIGLHPTFRPNPRIGFKEQNVVMCPARATQEQKKWLRKLLHKAGAHIIEMTPEKHDKLMGIMQVLVHFHTILFGSVLRKLKAPLRDTLQIMSPVYRLEFDLMARIFAQDPMLYASIEMLNPETKKILATLKRECLRLALLIEKKDTDAFVKEFGKINRFLGSFTEAALKESNEILTYFAKRPKVR